MTTEDMEENYYKATGDGYHTLNEKNEGVGEER